MAHILIIIIIIIIIMIIHNLYNDDTCVSIKSDLIEIHDLFVIYLYSKKYNTCTRIVDIS